MYVLTILHGASMIVQKPTFYVYFVGPAILFTIDKMVSLSRKRMEISIVRAENLASGKMARVTELRDCARVSMPRMIA
ncbi:hypothetical protein DPMN_076162 [Dreissena polymorpha]|uniref:Uncharacterized protein n=1 Tax=Dreissena polymorpha TaxID=45954 RepID=A0A9D4BM63_DREPO|nr:hypothetical protein DPMN_076162 [Dreissena polymorpha]